MTATNPRVLVVDDDELVATTTCMILNRCGFSSVPAFNAEDALLLANESAFDTLLTDVMMEPTNGVQLAVAFHALRPNAQVILFSGNEAAAVLLLDAARKGYDFPVLAKPIDPKVLIDQIRPSQPLFLD